MILQVQLETFGLGKPEKNQRIGELIAQVISPYIEKVKESNCGSIKKYDNDRLGKVREFLI